MHKKLIQKIKASSLLWKYSGLTYRWSVLATRGKYLTFEEYIENSNKKIDSLSIDFQGKSVLELGCGIGGNLLCIGDKLKNGVGLDINSFYIKRAKKLQKKLKLHNLDFICYDGRNIPMQNKFDIIFSVNVFERISKPNAQILVSQLSKLLSHSGIMVLFFLGSGAKFSGFANRLGADAYTFWELNEIEGMFLENNLRDFKINIKKIPIMPGETNQNAWLVNAQFNNAT